MKPALLVALVALVPVGCAQPAAHFDLESLERDLASGRRTATEVLIDPAWQEQRASAPFRRLMRDHTRSSSVSLVTAEEPGVGLDIRGRVTDTEGNGLEGVGFYLYHTDREGYYTPGVAPEDGERAPRLYGFVRTDSDGRYQVRTIVPGPYAGHDDAVPHVHFSVHAPGYERTRGEGPPSLYFADATTLRADYREEMEGDGGVLVDPSPDADGRVRAVYDWVLRPSKR